MFSFLWGNYLGVRLLGHLVSIYIIHNTLLYLFQKWLHKFALLKQCVRAPVIPYLHQHLVFLFLNFTLQWVCNGIYITTNMYLYKCNPSQNPRWLFKETINNNLTIKCIWKGKETRKAKTISKKKDKVSGLLVSDFNTYCTDSLQDSVVLA